MTARLDYPTLITFDTATPIAAGRMYSDGRDIRVWADAAYTQALPFYVENINAADTRIWTKVDHPSGRYHASIGNYWPLDGYATDIVSGQTGTINGTLATVSGQVGDALAFDNNVSNHITLPNPVVSALQGRGAITMECWFRPNSIGSLQRIAQLNSTSTRFTFFLAASGALQIAARSTAGDSAQNGTSTETFSAGDWLHIVAGANLATPELFAYVNGVKLTGFATPTFAQNTFDIVIAGSHYVGRDGASGTLNGDLDNLALYYRELTSDEVRSSYLRGLAGKRLTDPIPTAHWTFNSIDNAGSEVVDLVNGLNGVISGGVTVGQPGRIGQSFDFDGTSGSVSITDDPLFEPHVGAGGKSTWAFTASIDALPAANSGIISKFQSAGNNREFQIGFNSSGRFRIFMSNTDATAFLGLQTTINVPLNTRTHFACTYDQTETGADKVQFFIDGAPVPNEVYSSFATFSQFTSTAAPVLIGLSNVGTSEFHNGQVDDVFWSEEILTPTQIAELVRRSREGLRPDLTDASLSALAYWSLDNADIGENPQDIAGQNHGALVGDILVGQSRGTSKSGQSFQFNNATTDYVTVTDSTTFDAHAGASGKMSLVATINRDSIGTNDTIIAKWESSAGLRAEFLLWVQGSNNNIRLFCSNNANSNGADWTGSTAIQAEQDYHIAVTFDNTQIANADKVKIYVNGVEESLTVGTTGSGDPTMTSSTEDVTIGVYSASGAPPNDPFDGRMWDVQYYSDVLTPEQVADLYEKENASFSVSSSVSRVYVTYGNPNLTSASDKSTTFTREITGLVAAYDFDEVEGGSANDLVGNNNGASEMSGVRVVPGEFGNAREFDGAGFLSFQDPVIPGGPKTVSVRFRTDSKDQSVLGNYDGYEDNFGDLISITSDGYAQFENQFGSPSNFSLTGTTDITDGLFHEITGTWDGTTNSDGVKLYVDGYEEASETASAIETFQTSSLLSIGANGIGTPNLIDNLSLWLKADSLGLSDGANVEKWIDQSGNSNDGYASGVQRPIYRTNIINGKPAIEFNQAGTTQWFDLNSNPIATQDATAFAVVQRRPDWASTSNASVLCLRGATQPNLQLDFVGPNELSMRFTVRDSVGNIANSSDSSNTENLGLFTIMRGRWSGGNTSAHTSGVERATASATFTGNFNWTDWRVGGCFDGSTTFYYSGYIAELIVYERALAADEIKQVENYLSAKYGLSTLGQFNGAIDQFYTFNRQLSADEVSDLANNFGEVSGSSVLVRTRLDPDPSARNTGTTITGFSG